MKKIFSEHNLEIVKKRNALLVGYITAGYPNKNDFIDIITRCENSGLDVFEIGYPSDNPFADGEVIKEAHRKVSKDTVQNIEYWKKIRSSISKPIWIMGYSNDLINNNKYIEIAKAGVVDAFVIPDLDFEQSLKVSKTLELFEIDLVGFAENNSEKIEDYMSTFPLVYYQLVKGKSGSTSKNNIDFVHINNLMDKYKDCYIFGGFGITSGEKAVEILNQGLSGAIIGTTLIKRLNESSEKLYSFIENVRDTIDKKKE
ncbi:hypothetical protein FUSO7_12555 [Fusobacterium necrophorum BFTR-2]|nr:tryptophan synthase subunit alpha [Fusobacterium necrophorum]KDE68852.1 hypothetical protein FUSO7_12555 [Fusobacterium necrophorum BFTR-2]